MFVPKLYFCYFRITANNKRFKQFLLGKKKGGGGGLGKVQIGWNSLKEERAHLASAALKEVNCPKAAAVCEFRRSLQKLAPLQGWRSNSWGWCLHQTHGQCWCPSIDALLQAGRYLSTFALFLLLGQPGPAVKKRKKKERNLAVGGLARTYH